VRELQRTITTVGGSASGSGEAAIAAVGELARAEDLGGAKASFVTASDALASWVSAAGLASKVKGL
jgi:hypothetical protein